ncbi:MAG: TolC family protein [Treponema sp.]|nr:TolC family protein [Treponema sp.]
MNLKKNRRFIVLFCLALFTVISANIQAQSAESGGQAKQTVRLSTSEAVERALRNNLSLESTRTSVATKRRASEMSWNQFIPSISVNGIFQLDNEKSTASGMIPLEQIPLNPLYTNPLTGASLLPPGVPNFYGVVPYSVDVPQWRIVGNVQVSLSLSAAMFENMRRLRLDYEGGLLTYEKAKAQLERDVRKAYHSMLLLQENINLLRSSFENVERQVQMAYANYSAGLVPELTYLQARVSRENMRPMIDQAENGLKLSMAQFAMFLGFDYDTPFELVPVSSNVDFIPFDVADMIRQASAKKPDILELRQTILMLESARKAQVYAITPYLNISWGSNSAFIPLDDKKFFTWDDWNRSGSLSITLGTSLHSLLPWGSSIQGVKNLDDQITTASIGLAQLIRGTEIEIYSIILSLERARISAEVQAQTVDLAEQSRRLTEEAYRAGIQDYSQVQNAEQSLHQARVQMIELQFNYLNSLIDLEYAIGVPFGTLSSKGDAFK